MPKPHVTEADIERTANDYLKLRGWLIQPKSAFPRGWPDIIACREGRVLFIEMKLPGKSLDPRRQPKQCAVAAALARVGCTMHICHSLEEVAAVEAAASGRPAILDG